MEPEEEIERGISKEETDIYSEQGLGDYCENDEINSREEGFMRGYLGA